ncbi:MAG: recombinase family protein [Acidobacteria bacterium]|nr:recombinase family protein [Acidobacteriota bacterium]
MPGGRVFGYDNVEIHAPDGRRSHVERRVNDVEAAVNRRIFELAAAGYGKKGIAKTLNEEGAPCPRAQQARPHAWSSSSIHEILYRELHRGVVTWNKTKNRNQHGEKAPQARFEIEWMRRDVPALRIVTAPVGAGRRN